MKESLILYCKFLARDCLNFWKRMLPTIRRIRKCNSENKRIVYLLDVPTYLNLGDQAIGYAERCFFETFFSDAEIVEIEGYMVRFYLPFIHRNVKDKDIVVHIGGGNFGDLYPAIENNRLQTIKKLKNHRVIIFPQTIYYTDSEVGRICLAAMQRVIANHPDVQIVAREKTSFDFARKMFKAEVMLAPDIVLFLDERRIDQRKGILMCMRNDDEKEGNVDAFVKEKLERLGFSYTKTDTIGAKTFPISERKEVLNSKWDEFRKAQMVVTDRLHGMIFSVITGTPCLVFTNNNFKIRSFYDTWLRDVTYVEFLEDVSELEEKIHSMLKKSRDNQTKCHFCSHYQELADFITKHRGSEQ